MSFCYPPQIDKKIIEFLKKESTWEFMTQFVRAVFPMLIVLRLSDRKDPVMDKLLFYVFRMDKTLDKSKAILDDLEVKTRGPSWRILNDIKEPDLDVDDDGHFEESDEEDGTVSCSDDSAATGTEKSLGQSVVDIWMKRREKLVSDFAIAGWLLSPIPEIYKDSADNMTGKYRDAVDRLLKKMMASDYADDSDELAEIMNTFWEEFEQFKNKSGPFDKSYIWSEQNPDLLHGKSHIWHKKNSYFQTKYFGKFACRVCSKIVGMGSAERNWGDVKYLKSEKRSHLSSEAVEKQATIFGASCMKDADIERNKVLSSTTERYQFWEDDDFDRQFDILGSVVPTRSHQRVLKCYFEPWEVNNIRTRNDVSKAKFLQKYGGLEFTEVDHGEHYRLCDKELKWRRRYPDIPEDKGGWGVLGYSDKEGDKPTVWPLFPGCPLLDCLATYYRRHPELNVQVRIRKDQEEDVQYLIDVANKREHHDDSDDSDGTESETATLPTKKSIDGVARACGSLLSPCGGCGRPVQAVHKCDRCLRSMHPFCGTPIGEEGYGQSIRCPECDAN